MRTFQCQCGNTLYFENSQCLACGMTLGYLPDRRVISALQPLDDDTWQAVPAETPARYRRCKNYTDFNVCNWMLDADDPHAYCQACRLNQIIPNLAEDSKNLHRWYLLETAKRRLLYTLIQLQLPLVGRDDDSERGLGFQFLADTEPSLSDLEIGTYQHIITGHNAGLVTINLAEADPSAREGIRELMNESYRTLLGHFRHESGHYYWDRLIRTSDWLTSFREIFGDETQGYAEALARHYSQGPPPDWQVNYISAYAAAHPWEDWAESWAHYLHMVDTLDTANHSQLFMAGRRISAPVGVPESQYAEGYFGSDAREQFDRISADWNQLTLTLNALNRSMGLPDAYPFAVTPPISDKLYFIHCVVCGMSPDDFAPQ